MPIMKTGSMRTKSNQDMGSLPKIKPKQDLRNKTSLDHEMLRIAKEQEKNKRLVAVRVDAQTVKLVEIKECTRKKRKRLKTHENNGNKKI